MYVSNTLVPLLYLLRARSGPHFLLWRGIRCLSMAMIGRLETMPSSLIVRTCPASMDLEHSCISSGLILDAHCRCHSGVGQNDPVPPANVMAFRVAATTDATLWFCTTLFIMAPWNSFVPYRALYLSDSETHGRPTSMASAIRPYTARLCRQVHLRRLLLGITGRLGRSLIDLFRPGSRP